MSLEDKKKLDGIATGANAYSLPVASSSARGGVKTGYTANGKNYPVQLSNEQMYVNVPWTDTNTTYTNMKGASASAAGAAGLVPAPAAGAATRYLRSDGTWQVPPDNNTTYDVATTSKNGLMSAADKVNLNNALLRQAHYYGASNAATGDQALEGTFIMGGSKLGITAMPNTWFVVFQSFYQTPVNPGNRVQLALGMSAPGIFYRKCYSTDGWSKWVNVLTGATISAASLMGLSPQEVVIPELGENNEDEPVDLDMMRQAALAQINEDARQAIYAGFPYKINGGEYHIRYNLIDQANLNGDTILAMHNPNELMPFCCEDETGHMVWLDITAETMLNIHRHGIISHRNRIR